MTPVLLIKTGENQWRGPRGEIYNGLPTEDQLKKIDISPSLIRLSLGVEDTKDIIADLEQALDQV